MMKKTKFVMLMCIAVFLAALVCAGAASADDKHIYTVKQWKDNVTDDTYGFGSMGADDVLYIEDDLDFGETAVNAMMIPTFAGKIDGKGHVISNFKIDVDSSNNGLVGFYSGNSIKNLTLCNFSVSGSDSVGGLTGYIDGSGSECTIENVRIMYGNVTGSRGKVGGLVGNTYYTIEFDGCTVENCIVVDGIGSNGYVGGLVGSAYSASMIDGCAVENCVVKSVDSTYVGGLVGGANSASRIDGCTVENCAITARGIGVGGLVGYANSASTIDGCAVENCILDGGFVAVGGLVGYAESLGTKFVGDVSWVKYTWLNTTGSEIPGEIGSIQGSGTVDTSAGFIAPSHVMVYNSSTDAGYVGIPGVDNTFNGSSATLAGLPFTVGAQNVIPGVNCGYGVAHLIKVKYNDSWGTAITTPSVAVIDGATVTLVAYPESGYQLKNWTVTGGVGDITGNTFEMPSKSVTVTPNFVAASEVNTHFSGEYLYVFEDLGPEATNVKAYYDEIRKTIFIEKVNPNLNADLGNTVLNVTQFGLKDTDVQLIEVDSDVSLASAPNAFDKFTNAGFNYLGNLLPAGYKVGGVPVYTINATHSEVYIDALGKYTGEAITVDSSYAVPGQSVKLAVKPLQNYSVYGWSVYEADEIDSSKLRADSDSLVKLSIDEEGNILYVLTMPADFSGTAVTVSPKLRDQGSTFVTYVFLDADTYVMEIPADFSLTGINKTVSGKEVNITACDLLEGHNLKVTMNSTNGIDNTGLFQMLSVKDRNAAATYAIGEKDVYKGALFYSPVTINGKTVLNTKDILPSTSVEELIAEGNLKTDLQFTLKQMLKPDVIGKYKDKLTFTVEITTA